MLQIINIFDEHFQNPSSSSLELSRKSSSSSNNSMDIAISTDKNRHFAKGKSMATNDQKLRHDEHSKKSVRAKIAMFSTQNSTDSLCTATSVNSSNASCSLLRSTPSPVGNSGNRNSLSGQQAVRGGFTSVTKQPSSEYGTSHMPASSLLPAHMDEECDMELSKNGSINPYHRSMINVSNNSPGVGASQQRDLVVEKSQSHVDLTKSNDLGDYKTQKPQLSRVNSTEHTGIETRNRNENLHQFTQQGSSHHGRSQSLLEIGKGMILSEGIVKDATPSEGFLRKDNGLKGTPIGRRVVSDRSQSSSALLVSAPGMDDAKLLKTQSTNPNVLHTRRRHTLTKLKGRFIPLKF